MTLDEAINLAVDEKDTDESIQDSTLFPTLVAVKKHLTLSARSVLLRDYPELGEVKIDLS